MSGATEHREVEYKFRIPEDLSFELTEVLGASSMTVTPRTHRSMSAIYFDTSNLNLLRWGITLRRRVGGGDDGWHLKIPTSGDAGERDEIRVERSDDTVPFELASIVSPLLRRQELSPMAEVRTERTPFVVSALEGTELVEVVDDRVMVGQPLSANYATFREVEVELIQHSTIAYEAAEALRTRFISAGAVPSSLSKAAQALGRRAADPPDVPELPYPPIDGSAVDALQAVFSRYVRDLLMADVGVRRQSPDSVHRMRVACRRLRATLKTFQSLLDAQATDFLREELAWLATELGQVRDTEVQREFLADRITDVPARDFVTEGLDQRLRAAYSSALAALRSDRHDFLIEDLILLVSEPPVTAAAFESAGHRLRMCARTPWKRLRRSVQHADGSPDSWHRVRLKAKQARYAVEAIAPIMGEDYAHLGDSLAWVTDTLGSRQDAHVSILTLEELAARASGSIAFELGRQAARCEVTGDEDVRAFVKRWPAILEQGTRMGLD